MRSVEKVRLANGIYDGDFELDLSYTNTNDETRILICRAVII